MWIGNTGVNRAASSCTTHSSRRPPYWIIFMLLPWFLAKLSCMLKLGRHATRVWTSGQLELQRCSVVLNNSTFWAGDGENAAKHAGALCGDQAWLAQLIGTQVPAMCQKNWGGVWHLKVFDSHSRVGEEALTNADFNPCFLHPLFQIIQSLSNTERQAHNNEHAGEDRKRERQQWGGRDNGMVGCENKFEKQ